MSEPLRTQLWTRTATPTLVLNIAPVNGYRRIPQVSPAGRSWARSMRSNRWTHGSVAVQPPTLAEERIVLRVRVFGTTTDQVEARVEDLLEATALPRLLQVGTDAAYRTYRVEEADATITLDREDLLLVRRIVELTFPAQPLPTLTGV